jgi:hypothetical protein
MAAFWRLASRYLIQPLPPDRRPEPARPGWQHLGRALNDFVAGQFIAA